MPRVFGWEDILIVKVYRFTDFNIMQLFRTDVPLTYKYF